MTSTYRAIVLMLPLLELGHCRPATDCPYYYGNRKYAQLLNNVCNDCNNIYRQPHIYTNCSSAAQSVRAAPGHRKPLSFHIEINIGDPTGSLQTRSQTRIWTWAS